MDLSLYSLVLLPVGLGLLGFVEPCTIGAHLVFLNSLKARPGPRKLGAVLVFIATRALTAGVFGAMIAWLGQALIALQTGIWLVLGGLYLLVGLAFLTGRAGRMKQRIDLAPQAWRKARSPVVLGLAFGLNIPACAAPILFGLLGLAASSGAVLLGFWMMFLFGLFLSLPLLVFALMPRWAGALERIGGRMMRVGTLLGLVFVALGLWSLWFGLYVNPADWAGA